MVIKVKTRKVDYEIEFNGKYAVVIGDSASGKTSLYKAVLLINNGATGKTSIDCEYPVIAIEKNSDEDVLTKYHNHVLIFDEGCKLLRHKMIGTLLKNSDNYFIIMSRKKFDWLPVSVDNVFVIQQIGRKDVFVPAISRYKYESFGKIDEIITEDSKSSKLFFERYFPDINVVSAGSKSQITKYIKNNVISNRSKRYLVVYDASAFGAQIIEFDTLLEKCNNLKVLDWESFEHYILASDFIKKEITLADTGCSWESLERFCTDYLENLIPYTKSNLAPCLKLDRNCSLCSHIDNCHLKTDKKPYDLFVYGPVNTIQSTYNHK